MNSTARRRLALFFGFAIGSAILAITPFVADGQTASSPDSAATLRVRVVHVAETGDTIPIARAFVRISVVSAQSDSAGLAILRVSPGTWPMTVSRLGFQEQTVEVRVDALADTTILVLLQESSEAIESVIVSATRGERRIEDEPLRVEVLSGEEVEEKLLMTPGDITMMLNETSGLRVQTTSPSLGGAAVRVQGLDGRYTQILADGLPLYGGQAGGLGLLQIPPMDLGGVEIIKGAASALYGGAALGGVINLLSRRPGESHVREILANQTTLGGTDIVGFASRKMNERAGYSLLLGGHRQRAVDSDDDGWVDLASYRRFVARPRVYLSSETGSNAMITAGTTIEEREGGTAPGSVAPDGAAFPERLRTGRWDAGGVGRLIVPSGIVSVRGSIAEQHHRHTFGPVTERDRHLTWFSELAYTVAGTEQTFVVGLAFQRERYRSREVARHDYGFSIPSAFAQLTRDLNSWLSVTASGRLDDHSEYGTFLSPRISSLIRLPGAWTLRASGGTGYFAPTPFTEETEVVGLSQVETIGELVAERARSGAIDVGGMIAGVEVNATVFRSTIDHPVVVKEAALMILPADVSGLLLENATTPTRTVGAEALLRWRPEPFAITATYTFVRSTEQKPFAGERRKRAMIPAHQLGMVAMFEEHGRGRVGVEVYYTGRQVLEDNPYRTESEPYAHIGVLAERRFGRARFFINAENLLDVRQTKFDPLVRPSRGPGGRWTTDVWAPVEGRVANVGVRLDLAQ